MVFDIQIKAELFGRLVPQKPVIGACGSIYTDGELMKALLVLLGRNFGNFTQHVACEPLTAFKGDTEGTA